MLRFYLIFYYGPWTILSFIKCYFSLIRRQQIFTFTVLIKGIKDMIHLEVRMMTLMCLKENKCQFLKSTLSIKTAQGTASEASRTLFQLLVFSCYHSSYSARIVDAKGGIKI